MIDIDNEFTKEELERKEAWLKRTHEDAIADSRCGCTDCTGIYRKVKEGL